MEKIPIKASDSEEIFDLRKNLEPWQAEIAKIAMLPKGLRPPIEHTIGRLGISKTTYVMWIKHPTILKIKRILTKRYFQDDIPDILQAMRDSAIAGDSKAAKLFLEYVDEWKQDEEDASAIRREVLSRVAVENILRNFRNKKI